MFSFVSVVNVWQQENVKEVSELWRKKPIPKLWRGDGRIYGLTGLAKEQIIISYWQHAGHAFLQS